MPRYIYSCKSCDGYFQVWHGMKETQESCQLCEKEGELMRVPQIPSKKISSIGEQKVGNITEQFIEENNQLLKEMKKEARSQVYED